MKIGNATKTFSTIMLLAVSGFLCLDIRNQAQAQQHTSDKIYFDNFELLNGNRFLITQQSGEVLAQIYNAKDGNVEQNLIRSGRGPFELEFVGGIAFNRQTETLYIIDIQSGKIISFDERGKPLNEKKLGITYARKLDAFRDDLLLTPGTIITEGTPDKSRYPLAHLLDPVTLEVSNTLFFDLRKLNLEHIEDFDKTNSFDLRPLVISSFQEGVYVVVFESFNKIFLINKNSELLDEIEIDVNGIETPKIVRHPSFGYGLRTYTVLNDYVRRGGSIYFSFEQVSEQTQNGLIKVGISDSYKLSAHKYQLTTNLEPTDPFKPFQVTGDGNSIYGANGSEIYPLSFN
jgi:hypothetical protein